MFDKLVAYKGIIHERAEDAPFMGALVISTSCENNCRNCFNTHLKDAKTYYKRASEVIDEVMANPYNDGIILAGLEWSEHPLDAVSLIASAAGNGLKVMLYTGLTEKELEARLPGKYLKGCYVKYGGYNESLHSDHYYSEGVKLASTNQYVKYVQP